MVNLYTDMVAAKKYIAKNHQQKWTGVVLSFLTHELDSWRRRNKMYRQEELRRLKLIH